MPQYFAEGESYRVIIGDGRCANLLVILGGGQRRYMEEKSAHG
jgi:hypothetical protein